MRADLNCVRGHSDSGGSLDIACHYLCECRMLKKRVILSLCLNEGQLTRTKKFRCDRWYSLKIVDLVEADELILLDVTRGGRSRKFWPAVDEFSAELFLPLTVGGHMKTAGDAVSALRGGADKVLYNTQAFRDPGLLSQAAARLGSQSVVLGLDVRDRHVFINQGREDTGRTALDWAAEAIDRGAGEIALMDIERDGSLEGYNLPLIEEISRLDVPVVALGGCGTWRHMQEAFESGADGAATSVIHHLTASSLKSCKSWLGNNGVEVRP